MPVAILGPVKGNRLPSTAVPGSKGSGRPTAQKGGGGNKEAGSREVTSATAPTVTVSSDGTVTAEHFGAGASAQTAARAAVKAQRQQAQKVRRIVALVNSKPPTSAPVAKGTKATDLLAKVPVVGTKGAPLPTTNGPLQYLAPADYSNPKVVRHDNRILKEVVEEGKVLNKPGLPEEIGKAGQQRKPPESKLKGTPQEQKAARKTLQQARKVVAKARPQISGLRDKAQEEFAEQLSKKTGIPPKLAGEWVLQESGAAAAGAGGEAGEQNELGVGYPAHPTPFSQSPYFNGTTPRKAANATAKWMEGKIGSQYGYEAAPSIQKIPELAKSGASEQEVRSYIEGPSEWGTGHIAQSGIAAVSGKAAPGAIKNLKEAKLAAKELGLKVGQSPGKPSKQVVTRYKAGLKAAETLAHSHLPYVWGGGHGSIEKSPTGLDCSGAVSWVLAKMGVLKSPLTSGSMGTVLKPGPGAVTVFYNAGHTFMKIGEKYFGTSVDDSSRGLSFYKAPSASYLNEFSVGHVAGLGKKEAIQLGFKLPSGGNAESFPGMTVSSSGTTATIDSGAGTTQTKPGFSKTPIRSLSAPQRIAQAERALRAGDLAAGKEAKGPTTSVLDELNRKYGAAA